ncbi:MAG: hypothetical protein LBE79_07310 [Tannerella sp.]|nr:hypothetical protein [Tannerella sp.]
MTKLTTNLPTIGILGVGVIGSALARGFATTQPAYPLLLSSLEPAPAGRLHELSNEMTPHGLNAMAKAYISRHQAFDAWIEALNQVMERLSIPSNQDRLLESVNEKAMERNY